MHAYKQVPAQAGGKGERESEREFYLTPAEPGFGHMAAGAAELSPSPACRTIHEACLCTDLKRAFCLCYNTKRIHLL